MSTNLKGPVLGQYRAPLGPCRIDLPVLIESRLLVQANSGGGKSWTLRRLLEQTHGKVQQIVFDVDDEFHTLREQFGYVLAGRQGGDCPVNLKSAALLAIRLLELGVSAIISLSELKLHERRRFVKLFLEAVMNAPRELWHPVQFVIDEAHLFCPQVPSGNLRGGRGDEHDSTAAVIDLMTRGRKRGFCGILATQRISKLHKDAAAEANNKLIGRCALDVDMKRAADELGFSSKEQLRSLRELEAGHFFAFGPALSREVREVEVGDVATTHPRAGQRTTPVPPPTREVQKVLAKLADLSQEAEVELKTTAELRARVRELESAPGRLAQSNRIRELEAELATSAKEVPVMSPADWKRLEKNIERATTTTDRLAQALQVVTSELGNVKTLLSRAGSSVPTEVRPPGSYGRHELAAQAKARAARAAPKMTLNFEGVAHGGTDLDGPEQRILDAVMWMTVIGVSEPSVEAVAFIAGYRPGGGAFNNPKGRLKAKGLIDYPSSGKLSITRDGIPHASAFEPATSDQDLHAKVLARLDGPEKRILQPLLDAYPGEMPVEELARSAGYEPGGGAFNNPKGRLRSLGLITYPAKQYARAADLLFPFSRR